MISDLQRGINGFAISHHQMLLDLERARMTAEDLRVRMISPHPNPLFIYPPQQLTWREFAEERVEWGKERNNQVDRAVGILREGQRDARLVAWPPTGISAMRTIPLVAAHNTMVQACDILNGN